MRTPLLLLALACSAATLRAEETIPPFELLDAAGHAHTRDEWKGAKAVVLFFVGVECPVSNFYAPEMTRVEEAYRDRGASFYMIYSEPGVTAEEAAKHDEEYRLAMPALLDPRQALARAADVKRVLTAVVVTAEGQVVYRGRIDDRFAMDGKRREEATTHDLRDAIDAALAGKEPATAETEVFGCPLARPQDEGTSK